MADNTNKTILHELLMLQKESSERDTRIEGKMDSLDTRMKYIEAHSDKQDLQLDRLTEILSKQTSLSVRIENIEKTQESQLKIIENHTKKIEEIYNRSGRIALSLWKTIGGVFLTACLTTAIGIFIKDLLTK